MKSVSSLVYPRLAPAQVSSRRASIQWFHHLSPIIPARLASQNDFINDGRQFFVKSARRFRFLCCQMRWKV